MVVPGCESALKIVALKMSMYITCGKCCFIKLSANEFKEE